MTVELWSLASVATHAINRGNEPGGEISDDEMVYLKTFAAMLERIMPGPIQARSEGGAVMSVIDFPNANHRRGVAHPRAAYRSRTGDCNAPNMHTLLFRSPGATMKRRHRSHRKRNRQRLASHARRLRR
jgi:hypothetical protein